MGEPRIEVNPSPEIDFKNFVGMVIQDESKEYEITSVDDSDEYSVLVQGLSGGEEKEFVIQKAAAYEKDGLFIVRANGTILQIEPKS